MKKIYIITFSVSVIALCATAMITLMLMLPQSTGNIPLNMSEYTKVSRSEFTYEQTKNVSEEALHKEYDITAEQIQGFIDNKQYRTGNADPFTDKSSSSGNQTSNNNNNSNNNGTSSNGNGSTNNGTTSSNTTTSNIATEKTTNSNGGVANPSSTNK